MAAARQFQLPGGAFLVQAANSREWQSFMGPMVLEEATPGHSGGGSATVLSVILSHIIEDYFG